MIAAPTARLPAALAWLAVAIGLALSVSQAAPASKRGPADTRPNVVMVMTDDQTTGMFSKGTMPKTVKEIVSKGTSFKNAIITTPTCCPSRATFLTGQYGHNNGVLENDYGQLIDPTNVLPAWLQAAGYRTIHVGKFMNRYRRTEGATTIAPGWDRFRAALERYTYYDYALRLDGRTKRYGDDPEDYLTTVLNQIAVDEIERASRKPEPFYLQYMPYAPHIAPGDDERCEKAAVPAPRDYRKFRDEPLPEPESFNERDVSDKPSFIQGIKRLNRRKRRDLERRYGCALASLKEVDRGVGDIVRTLKQTGEQRSTVLIFVSDNGFFYGEHRIPDAKQNPYEESIKVPMAISAPGRYLGAKQVRRSDRLVANIDVPSTILDFAQAVPCTSEAACRTLDGRSLLPLLTGQDSAIPADRAIAVELARFSQNAPVLGGRTCVYTGIRTPRYAYFHYTSALNPKSRACEPVDEVEWYDLNEDPNQLESLAGGPPGSGRAQAEAELAARGARLSDCAGIQGRDPLPASGHWCE